MCVSVCVCSFAYVWLGWSATVKPHGNGLVALETVVRYQGEAKQLLRNDTAVG